MSGKQTGKVWELALPHNQLWMLAALADNAHHDGSNCYPGDELLAWKTGYDVRTVKRLLKVLRETDHGQGPVIEAVGNQRGGRGRRVEYQLHLDRGPMKSAFEPGYTRRKKGDKTPPIERVATETGKGDTPTPERVTHDAEKGDTHARASKNRPDPLEGSTRGTTLARAHTREVANGSGEGGRELAPLVITRGMAPRAADRLRRTARRTGAPLIHEGKA